MTRVRDVGAWLAHADMADFSVSVQARGQGLPKLKSHTEVLQTDKLKVAQCPGT